VDFVLGSDGEIRVKAGRLSTTQFEIGSKDLVRQALDRYRSERAYFADYLIGAVAEDAGCDEIAVPGALNGPPTNYTPPLPALREPVASWSPLD
jgi:hypothetical protein